MTQIREALSGAHGRDISGEIARSLGHARIDLGEERLENGPARSS